jgi:hypothetical protein
MNDSVLREQLVQLLGGGHAHMPFDQAVADFPLEWANKRPPSVTYTPWHLLEHLRIAQWDILDFIRNPDYQEIKWPDDYWPAAEATADAAAWQTTVDSFRADLQSLLEIAQDSSVDLTADIPHAPGYTVLRELLVVADHNAYHIGEFAILRQVMGTWPEDRVG